MACIAIKDGRGGNTILRNRVGDEGGWCAQTRGGGLRIIVLILYKGLVLKKYLVQAKLRVKPIIAKVIDSRRWLLDAFTFTFTYTNRYIYIQ